MFALRLHASKEKKQENKLTTQKKQENKLTTQLFSVLNPITY